MNSFLSLKLQSHIKVRLTPCFYKGVRETLAPGWDTGAVILDETNPHNRWELGPCSTDGFVERM